MTKYWDNICILNLKKDKDRLNMCKKQLDSYKLKYCKCIEGVNGYDFVPYGKEISKTKTGTKKKRQLLSKMRKTLLSSKKIKKTNYRSLRIGEIGCNMSHLNTMKYALKKGYNKILILEDDVKLLPNFLENMHQISTHIPNNCDILFLGLNKQNYKWGSFKKINKFINKPLGTKKYKGHSDSEGAIYGAHAYIINRKAMKEFIKYTEPMTYPADVTLGKISTIFKKVNAYSVKNNLIETFNKGSNTMNIS